MEIEHDVKISEGLQSEKFQLKKKIGLWRGVSVIAGVVVGSGIFVSPVGVLAGSNGSVGVSLLLWVACGLFSALAALCYAELGTTIRESGAEFAYLNAAYGGPLAFVYIICFMFIVVPAADATKAIVFGTYLAAPFYPGCDPPVAAQKCAAAASVLVLGLVNYLSVTTAARVQLVFTVAKFIGMLVIVIAGFTKLRMGDPVGISNFQGAFDSTVLSGISAGQIALAFYQGLFSYNGWNKLNLIAEEVKDVGRTLPRCITISVAGVTLFYILVNIAYLSVFGSLNGSLLTGGRAVFVAARRQHLPQIMSMIHVAHKTPGPAIIVQVAIILILLIPGDIDSLINMSSLTAWIFYGLGASGVLILRRKYPNIPRPYKVPIVIPVIVVLFAIFLIVMPIVSSPKLDYVYIASLMVVSLMLYYPVVHRRFRLPGMDMFTVLMQRSLDVAPTDWEDSLESHQD